MEERDEPGSSVPAPVPGSTAPPELVVVRHGDRLDWELHRLHGAHWWQLWHCGVTATVPVAGAAIREDTCLTAVGWRRALATGAYLAQRFHGAERFDVVLASPALRCVQTAQALLQAGAARPPILVEQGLFENALWCHEWRTLEQLRSFGFDVAPDYRSVAPVQHQSGDDEDEDEAEMRRRTLALLRHLTERFGGKRVLLVGHCGTHMYVPECLGCPLQRDATDLEKVPFCAVTHVRHSDGQWSATVLDRELPHVPTVPVVCVVCDGGEDKAALAALAETAAQLRREGGAVLVAGSANAIEVVVAALLAAKVPIGELLAVTAEGAPTSEAALTQRGRRRRACGSAGCPRSSCSCSW